MQYHRATYAEDVWDVFWYEKNLQGDIVAVYDDAGTKLIEYQYDAFGRVSTLEYNDGYDTAAYNNPFRYRGYYYDKDLDLYYLNARYYDGRTGRFISPDAPSYLGANGDLNGYNLYAYCSNNPVMGYDPYGTFNFSKFASGVGLIALGVSSIAIGIITLPYGGWISAVAGVSILSGGATMLFGLSDAGEGLTDYNVIKEFVFSGNEAAYNLTESIFATTASVSSIICGAYVKINTISTPRSLPSKSKKSHSGVWNVNDKTLGYYGADGKLRYSLAFNNHKSPQIHKIPHWHTELPHSAPINSFFAFVVELLKKGF